MVSFLTLMYQTFFKYFSFTVENSEIGVVDLYRFITGLKSVPLLDMARFITVAFKHGCDPGYACRPTASTCALTLFLPVHI